MPAASLPPGGHRRPLLARQFRFWVSVSLVLVLWWYLAGVLEREAERAAEMSASMVLTQLRSALVVRGAEVMLDRNQSLASQEGINPFELIDHRWPNYEGHCENGRPARGHWCFRASTQKETAEVPRGWLIYNPGQPITLEGRLATPGEPMAWKVVAGIAGSNTNDVRGTARKATGLNLQAVNYEVVATAP